MFPFGLFRFFSIVFLPLLLFPLDLSLVWGAAGYVCRVAWALKGGLELRGSLVCVEGISLCAHLVPQVLNRLVSPSFSPFLLPLVYLWPIPDFYQWFRFEKIILGFFQKIYFRRYWHSKIILILIFTMYCVWTCFWIGRRRHLVKKTIVIFIDLNRVRSLWKRRIT